MKKNLKLIVFTIVLCAVSILNVKVMLDIDYSNDLLMTSLVSVSRGEGDPDGGDDDGTCRTDITGDVYTRLSWCEEKWPCDYYL